VLPGEVLNPGGRKPGYVARVRARLHEMLDEVDAADGDDAKAAKVKRLDALLLTVYERAVAGDMVAAKLILDRVLPVSIHADVNVSGMQSSAVLEVFQVLAADYVSQGRMPELPGRD